MPNLARQLAATTSTWAGEVAPHAEFVTAKGLAADAGPASPPTLLTGDARRDARPARSQTRPHQAPSLGTDSSLSRLRARDHPRTATVRGLPRHNEHAQAPRPPSRHHPEATGHRRPPVRTSKCPRTNRHGTTRALGGSSSRGQRPGVHGPAIGVSAPHPAASRRRPGRRSREGDGPLSRVLRPDPRRPASTACPALGGASARWAAGPLVVRRSARFHDRSGVLRGVLAPVDASGEPPAALNISVAS